MLRAAVVPVVGGNRRCVDGAESHDRTLPASRTAGARSADCHPAEYASSVKSWMPSIGRNPLPARPWRPILRIDIQPLREDHGGLVPGAIEGESGGPGDLILLGRRAEAQAFIARVSDPASRLYAVARSAAFAFDGAWDEAAMVLAQGLDVDPEDWGRKGALAVGLLMLGIHDFTDETYWAGWQSADLAPAVRGDWQGAVVAFGAIDAATIPTDYWYYRRAQHLFRAGREAEALAQFDAVWPYVWPYGVADDPVYLTPRRLWYAQALRGAGRADEVEPVVQVARDEVAAARRDGMQSPIVDLLEAELAAWDGDRATALRLLPRGLIAEPFLATIEDDPVYASLRADAGFRSVVEGEQARRAQLRERFLRAACARPPQAKWHPAAVHCAGPGSLAAKAGPHG